MVRRGVFLNLQFLNTVSRSFVPEAPGSRDVLSAVACAQLEEVIGWRE